MTFDEHVQAALDSLPPELARGLENVAIVVEDEHPAERDLFGWYDGVPLPERRAGDPLYPDRIVIFRLPLEEAFGDDAPELERQIRITVLHELAHHFGLDEDRLEELGYA